MKRVGEMNNKIKATLFEHRIPVIAIVIVAIQLVGMIWWSAKLDSRMEHVEKVVQSNSEVCAIVRWNTEWIKENREIIRYG